MNEFIILLYSICFFHIMDMLFTIKLLLKYKKTYLNPEEIELNYHKYFMRKFGLVYGGMISILFISLPIMIGICYITYNYGGDIKHLYILLGINIGVSYINYRSYQEHDKIKKNLIKRRRK